MWDCRIADAQFTARDCRQSDERTDLNVIGLERVLAAVQPGTPCHGDQIGADARDVGTQCVEEVAESLDMRLTGGVVNRGRSGS